MKELMLVPSLLPDSYAYAFFYCFELFLKDDSSRLKWQDIAVP